MRFRSEPLGGKKTSFFANWDVLNSVFLSPCPPSTCDIKDWAPQLQEKLGFPSSVFPSVYIDRSSDFVVLTYPPPPKDDVCQGMINPCLKDVMQRAELRGEEWHLDVNFRLNQR